jgi:hypothetical protein
MNAAAGPLAHATLIVADAAPLAAAYAALGLQAQRAAPVSAAQAAAWGRPALAGAGVVWLAAPGSPPLLRLLECPGAAPRPTRFSHGWMALEILVRDVDALAGPALAGGFEIVGAPADLEMSASLRAMQLIGPAGEMLYLTQVKAPVPPFELPLSAELPPGCLLGPLFIGVMSVPDRAAALAACAALAPTGTAQFETKVTVLNRAHGRELATRWPLATVALAGRCLLEIDEVAAPTLVPAPRVHGLPAGLAWLTLRARHDTRGPALAELAPGVWWEQAPPRTAP